MFIITDQTPRGDPVALSGRPKISELVQQAVVAAVAFPELTAEEGRDGNDDSRTLTAAT